MNTEETQCAQLAVKNRRRQASHFLLLGEGGRESREGTKKCHQPAERENKGRDIHTKIEC